MGNLTAQLKDEFNEAVPKLSDVGWYGLANATAMWQLGHAGYIQILRLLTNHNHRQWLGTEENAENGTTKENRFQ